MAAARRWKDSLQGFAASYRERPDRIKSFEEDGRKVWQENNDKKVDVWK